VFFEALTPFMLAAAFLAGTLSIFSVLTMWRRHQSLLLPQPASLSLLEEARRVGLDEAALIAARDKRIVIVHIDSDGRHRIETPQRN